MIGGSREFVRRHPVATKRAIRAILKATDVCALEPERSARLLTTQGITASYDYAREAKTVSSKSEREGLSRDRAGLESALAEIEAVEAAAVAVPGGPEYNPDTTG